MGAVAIKYTHLVDMPCTLRELETAIHAYGDHHGFDTRVEAVLNSEGNRVMELIVDVHEV